MLKAKGMDPGSRNADRPVLPAVRSSVTGRQVLGAVLNCSESIQSSTIKNNSGSSQGHAPARPGKVASAAPRDGCRHSKRRAR
jgi:hypothetical protein